MLIDRTFRFLSDHEMRKRQFKSNIWQFVNIFGQPLLLIQLEIRNIEDAPNMSSVAMTLTHGVTYVGGGEFVK